MKRFTSVLIIVLSVFVACATFTACGNKSDLTTYWQTESKQAGSGENVVRLEYVAELTFSKTRISAIWINVSDMEADQSSIIVNLYNTSKNSQGEFRLDLTKNTIRSSSDKKGWIKFDGKCEKDCTKAVITVKDKLRIHEIYLVNDKDEQVKIQLSKGGVKGGSASEMLYSEEELKKLDKSNIAFSEHPAYNIVDEQDKIPVDLLK